MIDQCPNCHGKGHVINTFRAMFLGFLWCLMEMNDKSGLSRKVCEHCDGHGLINFVEEE